MNPEQHPDEFGIWQRHEPFAQLLSVVVGQANQLLVLLESLPDFPEFGDGRSQIVNEPSVVPSGCHFWHLQSLSPRATTIRPSRPRAPANVQRSMSLWPNQSETDLRTRFGPLRTLDEVDKFLPKEGGSARRIRRND